MNDRCGTLRRCLPLAGVLVAAAATAAPPATRWIPLRAGVEYAAIPIDAPLGLGDARLHVVRVDPSRVVWRAALASAGDRRARTARQWAREDGLAVAINMGMFQPDQISNVGYLRSGDHVNNGRWTSFRSAVGLGPTRPGVPAVTWLDLDATPSTAALSRHDIVVQNLRLVRGDGVGVWAPSGRRWSEAALGLDRQGRVLFLFSRTPLSMVEFIRALRSSGLGVVRAMHLEGGPEASLSIHAGGIDRDLCGSYETGFREDDRNTEQWPIPNVLGIRNGP